MNLTEMYQTSPDYIKVIWSLAPWLTLYAVVRVWAKASAQAEPRHVRTFTPVDDVVMLETGDTDRISER